MKRVTGIGGLFFKAHDPKELQDWYGKHLGINPLSHSPWGEDDDASLFEWRDKDDPNRKCYTVFAPFPEDTDYFDPSPSPFMVNFRVEDLDALLAELEQEGVPVQGEIRSYSYGRFARINDLEGNPVELWEPADGF